MADRSHLTQSVIRGAILAVSCVVIPLVRPQGPPASAAPTRTMAVTIDDYPWPDSRNFPQHTPSTARVSLCVTCPAHRQRGSLPRSAFGKAGPQVEVSDDSVGRWSTVVKPWKGRALVTGFPAPPTIADLKVAVRAETLLLTGAA
jgi:hypothetical protein